MPNGTSKRVEKFTCIDIPHLHDPFLNAPEVSFWLMLAQFGRVQDVVTDCCGYCPVPKTDEEKEIAEQEAKNYVSGKISYV
jgi:hypothetical protein